MHYFICKSITQQFIIIFFKTQKEHWSDGERVSTSVWLQIICFGLGVCSVKLNELKCSPFPHVPH